VDEPIFGHNATTCQNSSTVIRWPQYGNYRLLHKKLELNINKCICVKLYSYLGSLVHFLLTKYLTRDRYWLLLEDRIVNFILEEWPEIGYFTINQSIKQDL